MIGTRRRGRHGGANNIELLVLCHQLRVLQWRAIGEDREALTRRGTPSHAATGWRTDGRSARRQPDGEGRAPADAGARDGDGSAHRLHQRPRDRQAEPAAAGVA
jgi:hypothetical protein